MGRSSSPFRQNNNMLCNILTLSTYLFPNSTPWPEKDKLIFFFYFGKGKLNFLQITIAYHEGIETKFSEILLAYEIDIVVPKLFTVDWRKRKLTLLRLKSLFLNFKWQRCVLKFFFFFVANNCSVVYRIIRKHIDCDSNTIYLREVRLI